MPQGPYVAPITKDTPGAVYVPSTGRGTVGYYKIDPGKLYVDQQAYDAKEKAKGSPGPGYVFQPSTFSVVRGQQGGATPTQITKGMWVIPNQGGGGGLFGGLIDAFSDLGSSVSNAVNTVGKTVESAATSVGKTLEAAANNPLQTIETIALVILAPEIAVAMGVSTAVVMAVGSVAISAANGETNPEKLAVTAITSYVGSQASQYASDTITSQLPTDIQNLPSSTNTFLIKTASSAVGADAATTTAALLKGDNLEDALQKGSDAAGQSLAVSVGQYAGSQIASNIEDPTLAKLAGGATAGGTTAALTGQDIVQGASSGLAQTAGKEAGSLVSSNIEDPTLSKIAGDAVTGGVTAGLRGQDVIEGAQAGATQPLLDAAGNLLDQYGPKFSGDSGIDLSGIKDAATAVLQPISDAATKVLQPLEQPVKDVVQAGADTATKVLQPLEQPIKDVVQTGSDIATKVLQPLEQPIKDVAQAGADVATTVLQPLEQPVKDVLQATSDAATTVLQPLEKPIKDVGTSIGNAARDITSDLPNVTIPKIDRDVMQAIANQYSSNPQGPSDLTSPSIATTGSPASYAGEDIAILGDAPGSLGSKVSKKGGKYPWGDPEGTTALKEGLGV